MRQSQALNRHGRPERITIDGSQTNRTAILQCDAENRLRQAGKPIAIRSSKYMNNTIEQDHRRIKRRTPLCSVSSLRPQPVSRSPVSNSFI
ncbi:IS6 family transposase [Brucella pituitosa]|uniref:IS6 family transposase n=1 Tax=Brucella pituitosa TaxID=571256 RepID=A0ABS3K7E9_9HYPH|nr:IS6 family transposase [Brucella pituitosa]